MLNSDQIRAFLAVLREGNCVAAARRLRLDHSTVSRRLTGLEETLGTRLFDRSPRGLSPTDAALAFAVHAERIESDLIKAADAVSHRDIAVTGVVRVATPEIFGTAFLAPVIPVLAERFPGIMIELVPESRSVSLSKREADIAISIRQPVDGRLVARKLTDYRLGLYAAPSYLAGHGEPHSIEDLDRHRLISYVEDLVDVPELSVLDRMGLKGTMVFRSSTSAAQLAATVAGTGLAMLHRITAHNDPRLVRILEEDVEAIRSYWLLMHADLRRVPRVRAVADFLAEMVAEQRSRF